MNNNVPGTLDSAKYARPTVDPSKTSPTLKVHYFYASPLQIDDPFAPVPTPVSNPSSASYPLRPFSGHDNSALDKEWRRVQQEISKFKEDKERTKSLAIRSQHGAESKSTSNLVGSSQQGHDGSPRSQSQHNGQHSRTSSVDGAALRPSSVADPQSMSRLDELRGERKQLVPGSLTSQKMARQPSEHSDFDNESQGLAGMPFVRAPSRKQVPSLRPGSSSTVGDSNNASREASDHEDADVESESLKPSTMIPVGVSRLHKVSMPKLRMGPIYWQPVHDEFDVIRATWFYKDTMLPVESEVANLLEKGYIELRPWTQSWSDELNSAVEVGAVGEEKIAHRLWPDRLKGHSRSGSKATTRDYSAAEDEESPEQQRANVLDQVCAVIDEWNSGTEIDNKAAGGIYSGAEKQKRLFLHSTVIYVNEQDAVLLRPNLAPSAYHNRSPYASAIRNGVTIGVPVVRGFDAKVFRRLTQPKKMSSTPTLQEHEPVRQSEWQSLPSIPIDPSLPSNETFHVTDLVLVVHGIGQKLSERMESFHFTHAMNSFRRDVNVQRCAASVRPHLRKDTGGIMVLPVNWRSTLSFGEGGYADELNELGEANSSFSLQDITPNSLPSVRNIISDVMLDIPYYLSHHQPRMISAVIREANRIYRLWCQNHPGFEKFGRVHLIAHSLGSVMAMDILSKQPTEVDTFQAQQSEQSDENHFAFDTKNLFLCGSPAGFFLLLKKAILIPRKDRNKPSADGDDATPGVAGNSDTYGCLAVDNIYNVVNPYDPVAYQLNATIDAQYAASLKSAIVPSATSSWFSLSKVFGKSPYSSTKSSQNQRPSITVRLPSNVEMETHNFTREEIAEKRAYLLNDNGQIDYFLKYGGGPLEIQYLTMLGAHSSYWLAKDFVRMLVIEVGRVPGREGTLEAMRAVKKKKGMAV